MECGKLSMSQRTWPQGGDGRVSRESRCGGCREFAARPFCGDLKLNLTAHLAQIRRTRVRQERSAHRRAWWRTFVSDVDVPSPFVRALFRSCFHRIFSSSLFLTAMFLECRTSRSRRICELRRSSLDSLETTWATTSSSAESNSNPCSTRTNRRTSGSERRVDRESSTFKSCTNPRLSVRFSTASLPRANRG